MTNSIVYNKDCKIGMKEYPDKFFDLAIVDPPYGINAGKRTGTTYKNGSIGGKGFKSKNLYKSKDWDKAIPDEEYFLQLFRISKNQIIWGGNYFPLPLTKSWVFWHKKIANATTENYSDGELAWTSFDCLLKYFMYDWVGFGGINSGEKRIHPTQKPIALYSWLLKNYAKKGDKILDTHVGSGSSRIASHKLGFDFTGFEIDAEYWEDQETRYKISILEPLFDNQQTKATPGKLSF